MTIKLTKKQLKQVIDNLGDNALRAAAKLAKQIADKCKEAEDADEVEILTDPPELLSIYKDFDNAPHGGVQKINKQMALLMTPQFEEKIIAGTLIEMVADQILNNGATLSAALITGVRTAIGIPAMPGLEALILLEFTNTPPVAPPGVPGPYTPYSAPLQAIVSEKNEAQQVVDGIAGFDAVWDQQNIDKEERGAAVMEAFYPA